jgi:hypothetical protein
MLQFLRVRWSEASVARAILLLILFAAVIYGVYRILSFENARRASRAEIPGWEDIDECGTLRSFDGTKTIDFDRTHSIVLTEKSDDDKSEHKVTGTWSFDEEKERYAVSFENTSIDYQLIKPEDSSVCILTTNDPDAVNLRESWFGRIQEEKEDED